MSNTIEIGLNLLIVICITIILILIVLDSFTDFYKTSFERIIIFVCYVLLFAIFGLSCLKW